MPETKTQDPFWRCSFRSTESRRDAMGEMADHIYRDTAYVSRALLDYGIERFHADPDALETYMKGRKKAEKNAKKQVKKKARKGRRS